MIGLLQYFKKNNFTLFFGGFLIGSVVEYLEIYWRNDVTCKVVGLFEYAT